jgi:hypothetical protein
VLFANTTGTENTANGTFALNANTEGSFNTAIGTSALLNTTAGQNTAVGAHALQTNDTGNSNAAVGNNALVSSTVALSDASTPTCSPLLGQIRGRAPKPGSSILLQVATSSICLDVSAASVQTPRL